MPFAKNSALLLLMLIILLAQCSSYRVSEMKYHPYTINDGTNTDTSVTEFILGYKTQLNAEMQKQLVFSKKDLYKKQPESELGDLMAIACSKTAKEELNKEIDLAILNYGGIRIRSISKGWVRKSHIYELMPFNNFIVAQSIRGDTLEMVLDQIAQYGGWPVSGIQFQIKEQKADSIYIGDELLNPKKHYLLATSDYIANGGDNMNLLKQLKQEATGVLLRDAIIDYCYEVQQNGDSLEILLQQNIVIK